MESPPKEPTLEMFDLTETEMSNIEKRQKRIGDVWKYTINTLLLVLLVCFIFSLNNPAMWIATASILGVIFIAIEITEFLENRIPKSKNYTDYKTNYSAYRIDLQAHQKSIAEIKRKEEEEKKREERKIKRREFEYWSSLDPYEFEREIARLYTLNGYESKVTKGSGDGGIDIYLAKNGKNGIVQCKRYTKKVGPGPVRDLYGTMVGGRFKFAKIVCPAGFSDKAYEFSKGKNIELVGLKRIMNLVKESEGKQVEDFSGTG